jgi:hypothetical protein
MQVLTDRTHAYFDALTSGSQAKLDAIVTPAYQLTTPNGKKFSEAAILARVQRNQYGASKPFRKIGIGNAVTNGLIVSSHVTTQGYTNVIGLPNGGQTVTFYTDRTISWLQGPDGVWRVNSDVIKSQNNSGMFGT